MRARRRYALAVLDRSITIAVLIVRSLNRLVGWHGLARPGRGLPRRPAILAMTAVLALIAAATCSPETTHRVLVFFYDGVPPLDGRLADPKIAITQNSLELTTAQTPRPAKVKTRFYSHPMYWKNRCGSCHGANQRLLRTVRQGLCQTCHFQKPEEVKKRVHGPVAVNGCLACHRYHKSEHPKLLVTDAQTLCFHCHQMSELTTDEHHATIETKRCIECHDPHGGDDRFYLLPGAQTPESS